MKFFDIKPGDVVVITSPIGLEDRTGWLGIVLHTTSLFYDGRWDLLIAEPTGQGFIATYHEDQFEVIDQECYVVLPKVNPEVVKVIKNRMKGL